MLFLENTTSHIPYIFAGSLIVAIAIPWTIKVPKLAISLLLFSLVAGQLLRIPLPGQGGGLLLSDIAIILVLASSIVAKRVTTDRAIRSPSANYRSNWRVSVATTLLSLALFLLIINPYTQSLPEFLIAFSYWIRLAATLALIPAFKNLLKNQETKQFTEKAFLLAIISLALLGLAQLAFTPSLNLENWDPHNFRLFSTWLDPNFIGIFFAIALPWVIASKKHSVVVLTTLALTLTQSRSAVVALLTATTLASPLIVKKISKQQFQKNSTAIISVILVVFVFLVVNVTARERVIGLFTADPTVSLRAESLKANWRLAEQHTLIGTGYNAYQFAARDSDLISNFTIHSRAGSDSSLLNIWITTGLAGLILTLTWLLSILRKNITNTPLLISLLTLIISSLFVNSLLYSHLLIAIIVIANLSNNKAYAN